MNLLPDSTAEMFATTLFKAKRNSPHLFFAAGLVGLAGSVYLACRATLKLEETLEEIKSEVEEVNDRTERAEEIMHAEGVLTPEIVEHVEYERAKNVSAVSVKGAVALTKLYGPAVIVGGISVACLAGSHVQLTRRNAALTAAFTALSKTFDEYRARVREEVGEDKEREILHGIKELEERDEKNKKLVRKVATEFGQSEYARVFDESNPQWQPSYEFNKAFIRVQEQYLNHVLQKYGFVFLNDAYERLGYPKTPAGQIVGWIKDSPEGDGFIDFGLFEPKNTHNAMFDMTFYLDFNVDGPIFEKIGS